MSGTSIVENPLYPLPGDYEQLTRAGQREARVQAVTRQGTPEELVYAWDFFRCTYLKPLPQGMWYKPPLYPSPPAHYRLVHDIGNYSRNIQGMPRAFGKSVLLHELLLMWLVSRPFFKMLIIKSQEDFVREAITSIMFQLEDNERLVGDFGMLKPKRGKGIWSSTRLWLNNGAQLVGRSVMGKLLGFRPNFVAFDDAEFDPAMVSTPTLLTENFKNMFFNHVVPMLDSGCSLLMIGTLLHRKTFLYHMATCPEDEDPRVGYYNRVIMGAQNEKGQLLWKSKWSSDRLQEMRQSMGAGAFAAQMMNNPGTEDERLLNVHPMYGWYTVTEPDEAYLVNPLASESKLVTWSKDGKTEEPVRIERPLGETVRRMYRFLVADPIRTPSITSDWACVMVVGVERSELYKDVWYVLDLKLGRVKDAQFLDWVWEMGRKWMVKVAGIEAVSTQKKLVDQAMSDFTERALADPACWMPRIYPIRYAGDFSKSKPARISGLAWRFEGDKIKLPRHMVQKHPMYDLNFQIENFTEDMKLLQHDDALDTLAMSQFVVKPRSGLLPADIAPQGSNELLEAGRINFPGTNIPIIMGMNADEVSEAALGKLKQKNRRRGKRQGLWRRRRSVRWRSII